MNGRGITELTFPCVFANTLTQYSELEADLYENMDQIAFSVIMPTFNRKHCIGQAIDSVLAQDYHLYEIVIIDDGSSDGTYDYLESQYPQEIMENRIVLIRQEHLGVSVARNSGIKRARYDWICYLDTDNQMKEGFFRIYCSFIRQFQEHKCFYSKIIHKRSRLPVGEEFDLSKLLIGCYIDMNSFVHANMYPDEYLLFNPDLTRGVDYDFILKFCSRYEPIFIDKILVSYDDSESQDRITNSADLQSNLSIIRNSEIRIEVKRLCKEFASLKEAMRNSVQKRDAILVSPYWRLTEPVRNFLVSKPKLKSALKKILKTVYRLVNRKQ
ncbi:MAG: glycosyltransferase family 2 protein [Desulfomonilaceae bacterium]